MPERNMIYIIHQDKSDRAWNGEGELIEMMVIREGPLQMWYFSGYLNDVLRESEILIFVGKALQREGRPRGRKLGILEEW